jgi:DNA primase
MGAWVNFDEIKSRVRLEEVLRSYQVDWLRRSGLHQYRGRCPIHQGQGKDAFHVNLDRGMFHCFACGAGGNVLDLVAAMEGCSIRAAALRLQARHAVQLRGAVSAGPKRPEQNELVTKKREANSPLSFRLNLDRRHPYLAQRGISPAVADYFGVGYYGADGLMSHRIAIPIHDSQGRLVGYCGRALDGTVPRYRFPAGFHKSQVLFNYHRARPIGERRVVIVEGFFDCMRVHQAGFYSVVALMGVRLSPQQKQLLIQQFSTVVLMLDGDPAGAAASKRIAAELGSSVSVFAVLLPPDLQPDRMPIDQLQSVLHNVEEIGRNDRYDNQRPLRAAGAGIKSDNFEVTFTQTA